MELIEAVAGLITAIASILTLVYLLVRQMLKTDRELIAELRKDNEEQARKIAVVQSKLDQQIRENAQHKQALINERSEREALGRALKILGDQLDDVSQRLNRKEEENNRKAEIIVQHEKKIAALKSEKLVLETRLNESRIALALVSTKNHAEPEDKTPTKDITDAAAKVAAELQRGGEETAESPQEG